MHVKTVWVKVSLSRGGARGRARGVLAAAALAVAVLTGSSGAVRLDLDCNPGDVDDNLRIDREDMVALVHHQFGVSSAPCPDVNLDGTVDAADLATEIVILYNQPPPPPVTRRTGT